MRVLELHNHHLVRGGSDVMFDQTVSLLRGAGHEVIVLTRHNAEIAWPWGHVTAALTGFHAPAAVRRLRSLLREVRPDVVHLHNVYPLFSPSVLRACARESVPAVLQIQDYTLICPTSHHFRGGRVCESCSGGREYHCVLHNCRGNLLISAVYAARTAAARLRGVFHDAVAAYAAPSRFVRDRYIAAGYDGRKIHVVPNVVAVPSDPADPAHGEYAAYVGRLSPEKGLDVLFAATAATPGVPVLVAGDTSRLPGAARAAPRNVCLLGPLDRAGVAALLRRARFVLVPSICLDACPLACGEAMAAGLPPVASRIGGIPEMVEHGRTGLLFDPGNSAELARHMRRLWADPDLAAELGAQAGEGGGRVR